MTILSAQHHILESTILATYAMGLEQIVESAPGFRDSGHQIAYLDGVDEATAHRLYTPKPLTLRIWVAPWDVDGAVTHDAGPAGHIRVNLDALLTILGKAHEPITVTRKTYDDPADAASLLEATGEAWRTSRDLRISGHAHMRYIDADMVLRHPFWLGPNVVRGTNASHSFTPGGTAPISNMRLAFAGAGTYTDHTGATITTTGACTVNVKTRTVGGTATTNDRRNRARFNRPWITRWNPGQAVSVTVTGTTVAITYNEAWH